MSLPCCSADDLSRTRCEALPFNCPFCAAQNAHVSLRPMCGKCTSEAILVDSRPPKRWSDVVHCTGKCSVCESKVRVCTLVTRASSSVSVLSHSACLCWCDIPGRHLLGIFLPRPLRGHSLLHSLTAFYDCHLQFRKRCK